MANRDHRTERGALLAALEWGKTGPGVYQVEGWTVRHVQEPSRLVGRGARREGGWNYWACDKGTTYHRFKTFTDALRWIADEVTTRG